MSVLDKDGLQRFYTGLKSKFSALGHTHAKSEITDFAHSHVISEITSLQSTLDGKASSNHTHSEYASSSHTHSYLAYPTYYAGNPSGQSMSVGGVMIGSYTGDAFKLPSGGTYRGIVWSDSSSMNVGKAFSSSGGTTVYSSSDSSFAYIMIRVS